MTDDPLSVLIDEKELVVRMIEAAFECERPEPGDKGAEWVWTSLQPEVIHAYRQAARAAVHYVYDCINAGSGEHTLTYTSAPRGLN